MVQHDNRETAQKAIFRATRKEIFTTLSSYSGYYNGLVNRLRWFKSIWQLRSLARNVPDVAVARSNRITLTIDRASSNDHLFGCVLQRMISASGQDERGSRLDSARRGPEACKLSGQFYPPNRLILGYRPTRGPGMWWKSTREAIP